MNLNHDKPWPIPLRTLQVFEAAARHQSFTAAGRDIGITQSAVSRQVAELETFLGRQLFVRSGPALTVTQVGKTLAERIGYALADLHNGVEDARVRPASNVVTLSMLPSVAAKWLAPRLERFTQTHPGVDLRISATRHLVDFSADGIDAAIRYGKGNWPDVTAIQLGTETIQPVCSPEYARRIDLETPADLLKSTLIYGDIAEDWGKWFAAAGLSGATLPRGPKLGDDTAILQAALDGQGVALGRSLLAAEDLASGRLIAPFQTRLEASYSYWFVQPKTASPNPNLSAIRDWIVAEFDG